MKKKVANEENKGIAERGRVRFVAEGVAEEENIALLSPFDQSRFYRFFEENLGSRVSIGIPEDGDNISQPTYALLRLLSKEQFRVSCEEVGFFQGYAGSVAGLQYIIGCWDFPSQGAFGLYVREGDLGFWKALLSSYVFTESGVATSTL